MLTHPTQTPPELYGSASDDRDRLERQVRQLEERLAFYEGFDLLIQDNVTHARELFRLAAGEREAALARAERAGHHATPREAVLRAELEAVSSELTGMASTIQALAARVASALADAPGNRALLEQTTGVDQHVAIVAHGIPSARTALSLQRFVGTLPQVADVSAREFAGGVLRLDAAVRDPLRSGQFAAWEEAPRLQFLTERADVLEFAIALPAPNGAAS